MKRKARIPNKKKYLLNKIIIIKIIKFQIQKDKVILMRNIAIKINIIISKIFKNFGKVRQINKIKIIFNLKHLINKGINPILQPHKTIACTKIMRKDWILILII